MPSPNDIKKGIVLRKDGQLWTVVDFQRVHPGKGSSFVRTKLKNLQTGKVSDETFKASESLEFVEVQHKRMQYLYEKNGLHTFMDSVSYEQVQVSGDLIEGKQYLKEGLEVTVVMHEGSPITVEIPQKVAYEVTEAAPAVKGDTASGNVTKEVTLENGLKTDVPAFIERGDVVAINTETGEYSERVSK